LKKHLVIWIFLLASAISFGQRDSIFKIPESVLSWYDPITNTDSLKTLLLRASAEEKVDLLCELAYALFHDNPLESFPYIDEAIRLSDSLVYRKGLMVAYMLKASKNTPGYDTISAIRQLQKAESLFDDSTHWSLKYRIWFGIGQRLDNIGKLDSAMYYYKKPLQELDQDEAWYAHFAAYSWLAQYAKLTNDHETERMSYENSCRLIFEYPEFSSMHEMKRILGALEKLPAFYTRRGEYRKSVSISQRFLDTITAWGIHNATQKMYQAKFLGKIGRAYHHWGWYDSAIIYHDSAIVYFNKVLNEHFEDLQTNAYPVMSEWVINLANQLEEKAGVLIKLGQFKQAEVDLLQSIKMRSENNDILGVAMSFDKLGELRAVQGIFTEAVQYYDTALLMKQNFWTRHHERRGQLSAAFWSGIINESISLTLKDMGVLYYKWGKPQISLDYLVKSLNLSNEIGYQKGEAESLTALGSVYLYIDMQDSALAGFNRARAIYESMDHKPGMGITYNKLGDYYLSSGNPDEAAKNYSEALHIFTNLEMPRNMAEIRYKQGTIFQGMGEWDEAVQNYQASLDIADALGLKQLQMDCNFELSEIYSLNKQPAVSLAHYKKYVAYKDELYSRETNRQIAEIETRFNTQQKEQQILLLETENELQLIRIYRSRTWLIIISIMVAVILLWVFLYIRQNKLKNEQEKNSLQRKLLRSQMNPHFIFNALSTVQNSIVSDQPAVASRYLAKFSRLMRSILVSSSMDNIALDEELITIENYLALQKVRFEEKFDYSIHVDEAIDPDEIKIPPMMLQPFIENAIEHGFKHRKTKGMLDISFQLQEKQLMVTITDNGIGREKAAEMYRKDGKDYKSMATEITRQRIKAINRRSKNKITMTITDLKDENGIASGTSVRFKFPV
jgi:tetratricopeptide (TPR) repeat protein